MTPPLTTLQRVVKILAEITGAKPETITSETNFDSDLAVDELDCLEIIEECETQFDLPVGAIDLHLCEPQKNLTVADLVKLVEDRRAGGAE